MKSACLETECSVSLLEKMTIFGIASLSVLLKELGTIFGILCDIYEIRHKKLIMEIQPKFFTGLLEIIFRNLFKEQLLFYPLIFLCASICRPICVVLVLLLLLLLFLLLMMLVLVIVNNFDKTLY